MTRDDYIELYLYRLKDNYYDVDKCKEMIIKLLTERGEK